METIRLTTINNIVTNFNPEPVGEYIHAKISSFQIEGFAIEEGIISIYGRLTVENPEEICWRRAKRLLRNTVKPNAFEFTVETRAFTAEFVPPAVKN